MPENNFEREVQQKLEELKLAPSAEVWQKVETQIKKEKKRRVLFLLIFLSFLLCGGILFWTNKNDKKENAFEKNNLVNSNISSIRNREFVDSSPKTNNKKITPIIVDNNSSTISTTSLTVATKKRATTIFRSGNSYKLSQQNADVGEDDKTNNLVKTDTSKGQLSFNDKNENVTENVYGVVKRVSQDSVAKIVSQKVKDTSRSIATTKNNSKKSKWRFAISAALGMSGTGDRLQSMSANVALTTGPPVIGSGVRLFSPSLAKMSFAFKVAFSGMYAISKRVTISAGLSYKLYGTAIKTGSQNDSLFNGNYMTGTNLSYHNYYHFLDVPVEVQYRVGNNEKHATYVFAGVSLSQLIYTNALQFDFAKGVYYHDNSLFYKTGVGLTGGFMIDMFQKEKMPLQVGPDIYYSLSSMSRSGLYYGEHYSFIGLRFQKIIGKK